MDLDGLKGIVLNPHRERPALIETFARVQIFRGFSKICMDFMDLHVFGCMMPNPLKERLADSIESFARFQVSYVFL